MIGFSLFRPKAPAKTCENVHVIPLEYWIELDQRNNSLFFSVLNDLKSLANKDNSRLTEKELYEIEKSIKIYDIQRLNLYEFRKENNLPRMTLYEKLALYSAIRKVVSNKV